MRSRISVTILSSLRRPVILAAAAACAGGGGSSSSSSSRPTAAAAAFPSVPPSAGSFSSTVAAAFPSVLASAGPFSSAAAAADGGDDTEAFWRRLFLNDGRNPQVCQDVVGFFQKDKYFVAVFDPESRLIVRSAAAVAAVFLFAGWCILLLARRRRRRRGMTPLVILIILTRGKQIQHGIFDRYACGLQFRQIEKSRICGCCCIRFCWPLGIVCRCCCCL